MVSSTYRRSKSLAADVARWWNQLKLARGKYLDEISTIAKLVKTLLDENRVRTESPSGEDSLNSATQRVSLVEALHEIVLTMKDAFIEVERGLIDIMGNDLVEPLASRKAIELVRMEAKQLDLLLVAGKNYIKVKNRHNKGLVGKNYSHFVKSAMNDLAEEFRILQDQILQTEETFNRVYEEMTKQRELADLLEKKQFL